MAADDGFEAGSVVAEAGAVAPARTGRAAWSQALGDEIVRRAAGGETLRQICAGEGMPHHRTVVKWTQARAAFGEAIREARRKAGRGMGYGPARSWCRETAEIVFERMCEGEGINRICQDVDMPCRSTLYRWIQDEDEFRDAVILAREIQGDVLAERALAVAEGVSPRSARADEVRLRHMRWHIGKTSPRKYGAQKAVEPPQPPVAERITMRHYWMEVRDDGWRRMRSSYIDPDTRAPVDEPPGEWRAPPSGWRPPAERDEMLGHYWLVNRPVAGASPAGGPGADDDGERWL